MVSYSFLDTHGSITGVGGLVDIGSGAGCAEEGISYAYDEAKNIPTTGADGTLMHSLAATQTGTITLRLLKTSPINGKLQAMLNLQRTSAALWGNNFLSFTNSTLGDQITMAQGAIVKSPDNSYAKQGNILEWQFQGLLSVALGKGVLNNLA